MRPVGWLLVPLIASLLTFAGSVCAEQARRILLWPVGDDGSLGSGELEAARERASQLGDVVDLPAPAPAGPAEEEQRLRAESSARVAEAQAFYYEASFARAAEALESHFREQGEELAAEGCGDSLRHVMLWLGASLAKLDRTEEAVSWFAFAIRFGLAEIDRALFPPDVTTLFDRAREQESSPADGALVLELRPADATVEIDGRAVEMPSEGPLALALGRHLVVARRAGYRPTARAINLSEEGGAEVALELGPADPELLIRQVAEIRRDEGLRPDDLDQLSLVMSATEAGLVVLVDGSGVPRLLDASGEQVPWPEPSVEPVEPADVVEPTEPPADPVWRRWWFWVSLVGGAAVLATGVGVGVYYGTRPGDVTITIVPGD